MYRVNLIYAPLAQLVEQLTLNQWVLGSSPRWCTKECLTRKCRAFFLLLYFKKARSGAPSGILEQGGGTQCRKERHSAAFLSPRESPRWCTRKSRNECCGFFVAPFPPGRTRTSRKRSCSSRGDWSLNSVRRTEFLTRPLMVHQSTRCKKLQRVFYCNLSKKVQSGAPSGDENGSGPPPVRRAKTPQ